MRISRRTLLGLGATAVGALAGVRYLLLPRLLGHGPVGEVRGDAADLVARTFEGLRPERMWDTHVHVVGLGRGGTGCWVNPAMRSWLHPIEQLRYDIYMASTGVRDLERADQEYMDRLLALHRAANPAGRLLLMAFDFHVREDGTEDRERSVFHVPNDYVLELARKHPELEACASIHPYRVDALERLDEAASLGARAIKWLPNAMNIDPASPRCDTFFRKLADLGLPLITHTGEEQAVESEDAQRFGNPLRLRRALDHGVRVIAAHCASLGESEDLDAREGERRVLESFDLFMRLFTERQYESTLRADISALIQVNRCGRPLREILAASELHPRLVNGSDYPLPAIDPLVSTRYLEHKGYLTAEERARCNEVFEVNPLLFDLVVKRCLRSEREGAAHGLSPAVFETAHVFGQPRNGP